MRSFHLLGLAAACLLLGACGTSTTPPSSGGDGSAGDAGTDGGSPDAGPPALTVSFLEPESETVPTRASVHFRVQLAGVPAERVQLLLGEDVLAATAAGGAPSATRPSLALDGKGAPVVAWEEADAAGVRQVHVRRWDGNTWTVLGEALGALPGSTDALFPVLTLDAAGRPSVAWSENGSVFVRRSNRL